MTIQSDAAALSAASGPNYAELSELVVKILEEELPDFPVAPALRALVRAAAAGYAHAERNPMNRVRLSAPMGAQP